jgi:hypothetical protein
MTLKLSLAVAAVLLLSLGVGCGAPRTLTPEEVCGRSTCDACIGLDCGGLDAGVDGGH